MRLKITFTSDNFTVTQKAVRIYRVSPFGTPSGIPESTFTAEGQIIVGLGSGSYAVLSAPSASNLRMISDLTVAGKIKWGAGGDVELLSLTNKSGGDLDLGAVVVQDTGNDSAFDTTTTEGDDVIGVLAEGILNDASGNVSQIGAQTVLVQGNVSRGDYLISSTTAGRAKSNGSDKSNAFGIAVTAYAGGGAGSVTAVLFPKEGVSTINANLLINGGFRVAQRGTSFTSATTPANSDDTYLLDRWVLLSDGNDIVDVSQESSVIPTGAHNAIKLEVETINKQFGILQILEGKDAAAIIGGTASLSFQARMAAADDNTHSLKAVVLAWASTEDAPTKDIVSVWGATPSYVANWTAENTPSSNTLTTSWQTFTIENISIDTASAKNVAVFIFCDQTDAALDDAVYISQVKLESGASVTDYMEVNIADDIERCMRYYQKSYPYNVVPGSSVAGTLQGLLPTSTVDAAASAYVSSAVSFVVLLRTSPTIRYWDVAGNSSKFSRFAGGGLARTDNVGSLQSLYSTEVGLRIIMLPGQQNFGAILWDASAEIGV